MLALLVRLRDSEIRVEVDDFDVAESDFPARAVDHDIVIGHTLTGDAPQGSGHLRRFTLAREPLGRRPARRAPPGPGAAAAVHDPSPAGSVAVGAVLDHLTDIRAAVSSTTRGPG